MENQNITTYVLRVSFKHLLIMNFLEVCLEINISCFQRLDNSNILLPDPYSS